MSGKPIWEPDGDNGGKWVREGAWYRSGKTVYMPELVRFDSREILANKYSLAVQQAATDQEAEELAQKLTDLLNADRLAELVRSYHISVKWSKPDCCYIADIREFPSLKAHRETTEGAWEEIEILLTAVLKDMENSNEEIPRPAEDESIESDPECDECGAEIPPREGGSLENLYHQQSCTLFDPEKV